MHANSPYDYYVQVYWFIVYSNADIIIVQNLTTNEESNKMISFTNIFS